MKKNKQAKKQLELQLSWFNRYKDRSDCAVFRSTMSVLAQKTDVRYSIVSGYTRSFIANAFLGLAKRCKDIDGTSVNLADSASVKIDVYMRRLYKGMLMYWQKNTDLYGEIPACAALTRNAYDLLFENKQAELKQLRNKYMRRCIDCVFLFSSEYERRQVMIRYLSDCAFEFYNLIESVLVTDDIEELLQALQKASDIVDAIEKVKR